MQTNGLTGNIGQAGILQLSKFRNILKMTNNEKTGQKKIHW